VSSDYLFGIFTLLAINQRFNQRTQINEGQRTEWPKFEDTKGLIRGHKSMKDREHNGQKLFEDTKGVIRRHKTVAELSQLMGHECLI
jgi:hypothetical protein